MTAFRSIVPVRIRLSAGGLAGLLTTLLVAGAHVAAADIDDARRLRQAGEFQAAFSVMAELAEGGDPDAQYEIATMLNNGSGVEKNAETAVEWYRRAADQGHAEAQYQLGNMHLTGEGVFKDDVWAISWHRKAAEQGHKQAQADLTEIYNDNGLTPPDWSKPTRKVPDNVAVDTPSSWEEIGANAVPTEREDQIAALEKARQHGIDVEYQAEESLSNASADIVDEGSDDVVANEVTQHVDDVLAEAETVVDTMAAPAEAGADGVTGPVAVAVSESTEAIPPPAAEPKKKGLRGLFGKFFGRDKDTKAIETAEQSDDTAGQEINAANAGDQEAAAKLAAVLPEATAAPAQYSSSGIGDEDLAAAESAIVRGDYRDAVRELTPAAGRGSAKAQTMLGALYQTGQGVSQDLEMAASLYGKAAQAGDAAAQFNLANLYSLGEGVLPDDDRARHWYEQAAAQGHAGAQQNLRSLAQAEGQDTAIVYAVPVYAEPMQESVSEDPVELELAAVSEPRLDTSGDTSGDTQSVEAVVNVVDEPDALHSAYRQRAYGNLEAAFKEYETLAQNGSAAAQFELGGMYHQGVGVAADESWAVTWYRRAAEQGHPQAGERLQAIYAAADLEPPIIKSVQPASVMTQAEAVVEVTAGSIDESASSVEDAVSASAHNRRTDTGDTAVDAAVNAGNMAGEGAAAAATTAGVAAAATPPKSMVAKAGDGVKSLFARLLGRDKQASEPAQVDQADHEVSMDEQPQHAEVSDHAVPIGEVGAEPAEQDLVAMVDDAGGIDTVFSDTEVVEQLEQASAEEIVDMGLAKRALADQDYATAFRMFSVLAERGDVEAQGHLGYLYNAGEGVARDPAEGVRWYRVAATQGNADAQYNLAVAYAFGDGVGQDDAEAVNWYRLAADQQHRMAQFSLGISYAMGEGIASDDAEAVKWYQLSAEQGYASAQYNLAFMYRSGKGIGQDYHEAVRWYHRAAEQNHVGAQYNLGYMYRSGKGVERNVDEAIRWYTLAAQQGSTDAREDLATLTSN
jgi:TPR repeat protein